MSLGSTTLKIICFVHQFFCRDFPTRMTKYFTNLNQLLILWMIWGNISLGIWEIIESWKWAEVKEWSSGTGRESLLSFPLRMKVHWHRTAAKQAWASAWICCRHQQPLTNLINQFWFCLSKMPYSGQHHCLGKIHQCRCENMWMWIWDGSLECFRMLWTLFLQWRWCWAFPPKH